MKTLQTVTTLILVMLSAQCSRQPASPPTSPRNPIIGRYVLAGYNDSGQLIFTGEIALLTVEQNRVKGQCAITKKENAPLALNDQSGNCEGVLDGKKLNLDLAPELYDGGVLLEGELSDGRIKGVCMFDSYGGRQPFGRFEAVKRALG